MKEKKKFPKLPGYAYCQICDILYPAKFLKEAEEQRDKDLKRAKNSIERGLARDIVPCPMCKARMRETLMSLGSSSRRSRRGIIRDLDEELLE